MQKSTNPIDLNPFNFLHQHLSPLYPLPPSPTTCHCSHHANVRVSECSLFSVLLNPSTPRNLPPPTVSLLSIYESVSKPLILR